MVPPRRFSHIAGDISHSTERPKRQKLLDKNAHFDQMIQSMSAVDRDGHRHQRNDAYSPSRSTTLATELSFIKRTDARVRSSSASKASSSSHTCNLLPQWLINTFMTLSNKHPLRLMLPSDISEGSVLNLQSETTVQPIDKSAAGSSFTFNSLEPNTQNSEYLIALPETTLIPDDDQECWLEPLPFSTPGPGSLLGSSIASNADLSLPILQKHLSSVFYTNETHIRSDLSSNRSHTPLYSSDSLLTDPSIEGLATDEVGPSWKPSTPEEDRQSLFPNIYSTPGPRYCAPRPVHFDSPFEDPLCTDSLQLGYKIDYDTIDFHWTPFNRKNLVVPDRLEKSIYTPPLAHSSASDTYEYEQVVKSVNTETNALNPHIPATASPLLSISPTPFRFSVPPESNASTPVPKSRVQNVIQKPSTPKRFPFSEAPGIYISPLDEHRKVRDAIFLARHDDEDARNDVEHANSQASDDSIESWEENLLK